MALSFLIFYHLYQIYYTFFALFFPLPLFFLLIISIFSFIGFYLYFVQTLSSNFCYVPEGRKLIESIYPKNNSYLLMDRVYEYDKTIALIKTQGFHAVVPPKKNHKSPWLYDKQFYKQRNNIERYFLRFKCCRRVFTRYDKLDSIFISIISLAFISDSLFM